MKYAALQKELNHFKSMVATGVFPDFLEGVR